MENNKLQITLPNGKVKEYNYTSVKMLAAAACAAIIALVGASGYFYSQYSAYQSEQTEFAEYKAHKAEQQEKLQQLLQDNEKMLRDMSEISALEKKLRRAIIRDVDNSKLGTSSAAVSGTTEASSSYTSGQGGNGPMDAASTMAVLEAQNKNIQYMLQDSKTSVSQLLGEIEGKSGTRASFPDVWPTEGGTVSSGYGLRIDPVSGGSEYHEGIDIAVDFGTPIYAAGAGTVDIAGVNGGYGRYIRIDHGNGYSTAYGHMSSLAVSAGQSVAKAQIIGFAGSTGYSTGPHLHFEVVSEGDHIDPFYVLGK